MDEKSRKAMFARFGREGSNIDDVRRGTSEMCKSQTSEKSGDFANINKDGQNKFSYAPTFVAGDIPALGVDAAGTAGSAVVAGVPLLVGLGVGYVGANMILKAKGKLEDQYKKEKSGHKKSYSQRLIEKEKTHEKRNRYSMRPEEELSYYEWPEYGIQE